MDYKRFQHVDDEQLKRISTSIKGLKSREGKALKEKLNEVLIPELAGVVGGPTNQYQVVEYIRDFVASQDPDVQIVDDRFEFTPSNVDKGKRFGIVHEDDRAFALIAPGPDGYDLRRGVNIFFAHVDSPCLQIRPRPIKFEWDPELSLYGEGAVLQVLAHGGIEEEDWTNVDGIVSGKVAMADGSLRSVGGLEACTTGMSSHLISGESEHLDHAVVDLGVNGYHRMREVLGIKDEDDLGAAKLFFYPHTQLREKGDLKLKGYGLDDRICLYASVRAFLDAAPNRPTFIFGLDNEESGSQGSVSEVTGFVDSVLTTYLSARLGGEHHSRERLSRLGILGSVPAIVADVTAALGYAEKPFDETKFSPTEGAYHGFGAFIEPEIYGNAENDISIRLVRMAMNTLNKRLGKTDDQPKNWYVAGLPYTNHAAGDSGIGSWTMNFSDKLIPTLAVGVPVGALHRPGGETVNKYDFLRTYQAYLALMEVSESIVDHRN